MSEKPCCDDLQQSGPAVDISNDFLSNRYRFIVENSMDAIFLTSPDGSVLFANRAARELFQMTEKEIIERGRMALVDKEDPRLASALELRKIKGEFRGVLNFVKKDGTLFQGEISSAVFTDTEGHPLTSMIIRDISKHKRIEEQYRAVVEDQTELISRFKADGTLTFVNERYCRFFGKNSKDLIGNKWQPQVVKDDLQKITRQLKAISPQNPVAVIENRVLDPQGRKCWMQFVNRGFFDEKGRLVEMQSVGRDISILKDKERLLRNREKKIQKQAEELQKINLAMEVLLEHRNRQLEQYKGNFYRNFNKLILPDLKSLKENLKNDPYNKAVSMIIQNIETLFSSDTDHLTSENLGLTKTELKIAKMIQCDMTSTEIAEHLKVSPNTVGFHRKNLRKKLEIRNSKTVLSQYLKKL